MVNSYSDWSPCVSSVFFLSNSPAGFSTQPSLAYRFFSPDVLSNGGGSHHNKHTGRPSFKTCLLTVIWPQNYDDHYCNFQTLWISLASKPSKPYRCRRSRQWYIYIYRFQNVFLRCPTPRLHCFISSYWPSCRFLSFTAFLIPSIQFFFGLPPAFRQCDQADKLSLNKKFNEY